MTQRLVTRLQKCVSNGRWYPSRKASVEHKIDILYGTQEGASYNKDLFQVGCLSHAYPLSVFW